MKKVLNPLFILLVSLSFLNAQTHEEDVLEFQKELNEEYQDESKSPLTKTDLRKFKGHDFFPIDEKFKVKASFERVVDAVPFLMKTTTDRLPSYQLYGVATFEIDNTSYQLNIYQNLQLLNNPEYRDYLFLPFTDLSNGEDSYGGGRFIGLTIPEGDFITIDFNKAYNPYCAYNARYSCPIPPKENHLELRVEAGVRYEGHH